MRYIIVLHKWFGNSSEGFIVEESSAISEKEAQNEARELKENYESDFTYVSYKIIPISDNEHVENNRHSFFKRFLT